MLAFGFTSNLKSEENVKELKETSLLASNVL